MLRFVEILYVEYSPSFVLTTLVEIGQLQHDEVKRISYLYILYIALFFPCLTAVSSASVDEAS
uniref:Uncharacterized protein n=1 Tax=Octopus bimaculoides TaxID=37653 RepID=A0A0L8G4X8_OCTBM